MRDLLATSPIEQARHAVRDVGWLAQIPEEIADQFLARTSLCRVEAGCRIYDIGDPGPGMYGLVSGSLRISIAPDRTGPHIIHFAGPGYWLGQTPIVTGLPTFVGLEATRDSTLLHLSERDVMAMIGRDPAVWRWLAVLSLQHTRDALAIVDDLMIRNSDQRCVAILLRLAGYRSRYDQCDCLEPIDVTQDALAEMVNVSRNTLGGVLRRLAKRDLISVQYRQVRILDPIGLDAVLDEE